MLAKSKLKRWWFPVTGARDVWLLNAIVPVMWVVVASAAYLAFAKGNAGEGIAHMGMLMVVFCAMIGPYMWGIVHPSNDGALGKLLTIATLLGFLIMATGWLIRLTT